MSDATAPRPPPVSTNEWVLKGVVPVLVESVTWTFSLSCLLLLIFLQVQFRRQPLRKNRILIMGMLVLMFCLTTLLYAMDLFWFFYEVRMRASAGHSTFRLSLKEIEILDVLAQTTLIVLMLLGDSIVLWRAVALSADNKIARRLLIAPIACLLAYLGTMPVALICVQGDTSNTEKTFVPTGSCRPTVLANLSLSLLTNILSTCIIAYIGWSHRAEMRYMLQRSKMSMAQKILRLLSEAGFIYFLVNAAFILIMSLASHTNGTSAVVTLIFTDIMPHVSVIIPVMTFILVLSYGSLWEVASDKTRVTPIQFTTLPPSTLMRTTTERSRGELSDFVVEIGPEKSNDSVGSEARNLDMV